MAKAGLNFDLLGFYLLEKSKQCPKLFCIVQRDMQQRLYEEITGLSKVYKLNLKTFLFPYGLNKKSFLFELEQNSKINALIANLNKQENFIVLLSKEDLEVQVSQEHDISANSFVLKVGDEIDMDILTNKLVEMQYDYEYEVHNIGEYAKRGSIIDIYSPLDEQAYRLDFFDTELETIKIFNPDTQISRSKVETIEIIPRVILDEKVGFKTLYKEEVFLSFDEEDEQATLINREDFKHITLLDSFDFTKSLEVSNLALNLQKELLQEQLKQQNFKVYFCSKDKRNFDFFAKEFASYNLIHLDFESNINFIDKQHNIIVLSANYTVNQQDYTDVLNSSFEEGDYVIHLDYGVAIFHGIKKIDNNELIELEFADNTIYMQLNQVFLLSKYMQQETLTKLSSLSSKTWQKQQIRVQKNIHTLAQNLLKVEAQRHNMQGFKFDEDDELQLEFEKSFPYEETASQKEALKAIKSDMQSHKIMDRLLCGDVGFGKTEIALRAMFKAILNHKQVAFIAPSTVLVQQHFNVAMERMKSFGVNIALLSRLVSKKNQQEVIEQLANRQIDLIIGTHRLLQEDIMFYDLGLLVIDEEHKFGVKSKEAIKKMRFNVDILSLSATPIPRTLYFSLSNVRSLSNLISPPKNRKNVHTMIHPYSKQVLKDAILTEVKRKGQVFYLHNRVQTIDQCLLKIQQLLPNLKAIVIHGQMPEKQLIFNLNAFQQKKADILIATTIIESGLDISNANTIIIEDAQNFGLAELHQLRGRVGRGNRQAYCYLFTVSKKILSHQAKQRLNAIQKYSYLGAGFNISMKDLEIRGAGNILGKEQSGHMQQIGFELYFKFLKQSIDFFKNNKQVFFCNVQLDFISFQEFHETKTCAFIAFDYILNQEKRLGIYRLLHEMTNLEELRSLENQLNDRFGKMPAKCKNLFLLQEIKTLAIEKKISSIKTLNKSLKLQQQNIQKTYLLQEVSLDEILKTLANIDKIK